VTRPTIDFISMRAFLVGRWALYRRIAFVVLSVIGIATTFLIIFGGGTTYASFGYDAASYHMAGRDLAHLYDTITSANGVGLYRYAPVWAQFPLSLDASLDWYSFLWLWTCLTVGTLIFLGGRYTLPLLAFPPIAIEIYHGNIHLLLAAAIVLGFSRPATWSFVLLTKVTPGIGLLWFVVRREWRPLAIALGATAALVAGSIAIGGVGPWTDWIAALARTPPAEGPNHVSISLAPRLVVAAALIVWGARGNHRWVVPVGAMLALPTLWFHGFAMLAALVWLRRTSNPQPLPEWLPSWPFVRYHRLGADPLI
jgi:hypothetical protein